MSNLYSLAIFFFYSFNIYQHFNIQPVKKKIYNLPNKQVCLNKENKTRQVDKINHSPAVSLVLQDYH